MSILDTVNKYQTIGDLEKGFKGNQHINAEGGGIEYHSGVKGAPTFKSQAKPKEGYQLTAKADPMTLLWRATITSLSGDKVYSAPLAQSSKDDALQHGRDLLSGKVNGFY